LKAGVQPSRLAAPVRQLLDLNAPETVSKNLEVTFSPLNTYQLDKDGGAVRKTLNILSLVSLGILLMAIINFVNIMMGTSSYRIKEIGLRKVFGGKRLQLVLQYLTESVVLTLAATLLSLCLYALFRPLFNEMLKTGLPALYQFDGRQAGLLCLLVLAVGCAAGIYPAFILSGAEVVPSVKGKISLNEKGGWMRKALLVIQFTVAVVVFIFAATITRQVNYFFDKDLGYNREQLMVITAFPKRWDSVGVQKMLSVRDGLRQMPAVQDASLSFEIPDRTPPGGTAMTPSGSKEGRPVTIPTMLVDEHYASTFGLKLLAGRFFKKDEAGYTPGEMVISESAVKAFGWKDPIGKQVRLAGGGSATIVGVIRDYNYASLHEAAGPLAMMHVRDGQSYRYLTVKLRSGQLNNNIGRLKNKWKELSPNAPFEYFFMDEKFQSMYESEMHLKQAAVVATGLMGLIVMLGVFGVLTLALVRRTREIAVRKVLGAEVMHIIMLFIRQYAALIGVALLIAWPLAWLVTGRWLRQYAYRIPQEAGNYLLVGAIVCAASFLLIGLQCMKVALANPVKSLKTE
jgi:putative ABC transport system permease protein